MAKGIVKSFMLIFLITFLTGIAQATEKPEVFVQIGHSNDVNSVSG